MKKTMQKTYRSRAAQLAKRVARPLTPGQVVGGLLEELELSQTELAQRLDVSRATVNELINDKRALTPDMAHRLGRYFGNGTAVWLQIQNTVTLWDALHADTQRYEKIEPHAIAA